MSEHLAQMIVHPFALADRSVGIGSTDARIIAEGMGWYQLYLEKIGEATRVDLSQAWKPQLGLTTEDLHAWWHGLTEKVKVHDIWKGAPVTREGLPMHHFTSLDRIVETGPGLERSSPDGFEILEMKHTNERASLREKATFYMGQLQWQLHITNQPGLRFSIIRGNNEPEWGWVQRDQDYIDKLIGQVEAFWWHVTNREPPEKDPVKGAGNADALAAAGKQIPLNGFKPYDMEGNNEWADAAWPFIRDKVASETLKENEKRIRGLIPADAELVTGHGLTFKRDARGAYRVTIDEGEIEAWRASLAVGKQG